MATMRDVIFRSFRLLGVIASGETPQASELADAVTSLNAMLQSWNLERLFIYSISDHTFTLVPGKQVYSLGSGADFDLARPNQIDQAYVIYTQTAAQPATIPIKILSTDEWASKETKQVTSTFPTELYNDGSSPNSNVYFWPVPLVSVQITLWTWDKLGNFTGSSITDDITLPDGYEKAIAYNLAVELAPEYNKQISVVLATGAAESKANIKRINQPDLMMACDPALTSGGGWDYRIGEYRS